MHLGVEDLMAFLLSSTTQTENHLRFYVYCAQMGREN